LCASFVTRGNLAASVALRVAAEAGGQRRLQEGAAHVHSIDETQQADARAVRGQGQAHVSVEMPADFSGAAVRTSCDLCA
jgi:hypothetical protein